MTAVSLSGLLLVSFTINNPITAAEAIGIDDCQYASDSEARAAWRPMGATAPVAVAVLDDGKALRLPCNFAGAKIERSSWDRRVTLDLSACRGLEFQLLCREASPVTYFSFYLQSGEGWYHSTFYPESSNSWNVISLNKASFGTEGKPAGWGQIRTLRVSAWRGQDRNTEFYLRGLRPIGMLGLDAAVAVVRGESVAQARPGEMRNVTQYTETIVRLLEGLGIGSAVLSDLDLTNEKLTAAKLVILPYNPSLPTQGGEVVRQYVRQGGKLLVFYTIPESVRGLLKVQGGAQVREARPGHFASIHPRPNALKGAPAKISQRSWNIHSVQPVAGEAQVLAEWFDDNEQPTGQPAVVGAINALFMSHVLLPDDADNKGHLLLAMAGYLAPDLWQQAAQASLDRPGISGAVKDFTQTAAMVASLAPNNEPAAVQLAAARAAHQAALELASRREFTSAWEQANAAKQRLLSAWCLAQPSLPGEFRAFWCHSAFGLPGLEWEEAIRMLSQNGFTAILPNMLWGGAAFYESKALPVASEAARRGDQIALCVAAAHKYGLQVHVWKVNWNLGQAAPPAFVEQMRRASRLQANARGQEERWLCPSHPENQKLEIASMLEVARNYDVDGLHFDYIRYPDSDHCFCPGCRERFQRATKATITNWPGDVLANNELRQQWLDWRRANITAVVRAVSEQAHALKPGLKISAAVFRNWPTDRDGVGQDWKLWCERGWLDFVCPMDYTGSARQFENMVARQVEWAGRIPCYPGIGESASSSRLGVDGVIEQINITRRYNTRGFVVFNYGLSEAKELLPKLGVGITAKK